MKTILMLLAWPVVLICDIMTHVWYLTSVIVGSDRAINILLGYDRLGNVAMGQGNETISSWAGRNNSWLEKPINWVFKILTGEDNHCDRHREIQ